ncbi:MAG TPA: transposase, partial [Terracidiphilus sp.]|nr:transposase [Terracidiphilus sp.]
MAWQWPPGGWKSGWTACWIGTFAVRRINQRLAKHLRHEQAHLFTFLRCPGLHATNNFAERAIRLMAMARKTWGGNRTANGARIQQILASVLRTCWQQGKDAFGQLLK